MLGYLAFSAAALANGSLYNGSGWSEHEQERCVHIDVAGLNVKHGLIFKDAFQYESQAPLVLSFRRNANHSERILSLAARADQFCKGNFRNQDV